MSSNKVYKLNNNLYEEESGKFISFLLLENDNFDKDLIKAKLKDDWDLDIQDEDEGKELNDNLDIKDILFFKKDDYKIFIMLLDFPIPNDEASVAAKSNYMWSDAVEVTKRHKAHLMISILNDKADIFEKAKLLVKVVSACTYLDNALAIYQMGCVHNISLYRDLSFMMKDSDLMPFLNLIWIGLYKTSESTVSAYTLGMHMFGKDDMEIIDAKAQPSDVYDFLLALVQYVIEYDVILKDGETIGFSDDDKKAISKSLSNVIDYETLKIEF